MEDIAFHKKVQSIQLTYILKNRTQLKSKTAQAMHTYIIKETKESKNPKCVHI